MTARASELFRKLSGYRYVLLVAAVGLVLLLLPSGADRTETDGTKTQEEARLEALLGRIEEVGRTEVLLSDSGAVVVSEGAGKASVRLAITQAVRCYTGLGANEVTIFIMDDEWRKGS